MLEVQADATALAALAMTGDTGAAAALLDEHDGDNQTKKVGYWGEVSPGTCAIDIWIADASQLRKGYGTVMMKHAIDRSFHEHNAHAILVDPLAENGGAISFYQHLGFEVIGPRTFGADECIVLRLCRPDSRCD